MMDNKTNLKLVWLSEPLYNISRSFTIFPSIYLFSKFHMRLYRQVRKVGKYWLIIIVLLKTFHYVWKHIKGLLFFILNRPLNFLAFNATISNSLNQHSFIPVNTFYHKTITLWANNLQISFIASLTSNRLYFYIQL